jgi:hypothetical protein
MIRIPLTAVASAFVMFVGCAQPIERQETGYVGAPGIPPPKKTLSVAQYGAFGYTSEENYCHTARWVINGTTLPQYADDPHPVAIKRGTKAVLVEHIQTDCAAHGGNDIQNTELTHVRVVGGKFAGEDRYILPSDWYTQAAYDKYAQDQTRERKIAAVLAAKLAAARATAIRKADHCYEPGALGDKALDATNKDAWQSAYDTAEEGLVKNKYCTDPRHKLLNAGSVTLVV